MLAVEMRDDDEGCLKRRRHPTEEAPHRLDAARRRTDADDREVVLVHHCVLSLRIDAAPFLWPQQQVFSPDIEDDPADQPSFVASCTT